MEFTVPHTIHPGTVEIPPSKSMAQRYIVASSLSNQTTKIFNCGESYDVISVQNAVQSLGAEILKKPDHLEITGFVHEKKSVIPCGESGLGSRLLIPVAAALGGQFRITGEGSLLKRPMTIVENLLRGNGIAVESNHFCLPISMNGKLKGGNFKIDGSKSSQFISGLLMALPLCEEDSTLEIFDLTSRPYLNLTLQVLDQFDIYVEHENLNKFKIPGSQAYAPMVEDFFVEGDYSSASFFIVLGAVSEHPVILKNLDPNSAQGDRAIIDLVSKTGAGIKWKDGSLHICKGENKTFEFDSSDSPDLFPPLVVLAASAVGASRIRGVRRLFEKESNRAEKLQSEFARLGLKIDLDGDEMVIHGTGKLVPGKIHSHNDHRIAMAGAISAVLTTGEVEISGAEAVNKSYPSFWKDLQI